MLRRFAFAPLAILLALPAAAERGAAVTTGIVVGPSVALRTEPSRTAPVVKRLATGARFAVIERGGVRDALGGGGYGHFWYKVLEDRGGGAGWLHGSGFYLVQTAGREFLQREVPAEHHVRLAGGRYTCALAIEQAYPPLTADGITGSEVKALPFLSTDDGARRLVWVAGTGTPAELPFRRPRADAAPFLLKSNNGFTERLAEVTVLEDGVSIRLVVAFDSQTGGGAYRIDAKLAGDALVITDWKLVRGKFW